MAGSRSDNPTFSETTGGTYRQEGDYPLPDLEVSKSPRVGIWGKCRYKYLRAHQKVIYTAMLLTGELYAQLEDIDWKNSIDIKTVYGMQDHFSAGFTMDTYAHVTTSAQKEAAETMGNVLSM